jgi:ABC-type Fe3+ transport system permease subunit
VTTADADRSTQGKPGGGGGRLWLSRLIAIVIALVVAVLGYFIVAAFIPRWWAQRLGDPARLGSRQGVSGPH